MKLKYVVFLLCIVGYKGYPFTYFSAVETLQAIKEIIGQQKKGGLLRFGDGDVALATGTRSGTHDYHPQLQQEMIEAFGMNDPYLLKTLPLVCKEHGGAEAALFYINQRLSEEKCCAVRNTIEPLWGEPIDHVYSLVALPYTAIYMPDTCIEFLKFIRSQNCQLFIGNKSIPRKLIRLLFGDCAVVTTPSKSAYTEVDRIERDCLNGICKKSDEYRLVILSCGNTGRVLLKRLWPQLENVFFFDMGSLMDALCGWQVRGWIRTTKFNNHRFLARLRKLFRPEFGRD